MHNSQIEYIETWIINWCNPFDSFMGYTRFERLITRLTRWLTKSINDFYCTIASTPIAIDHVLSINISALLQLYNDPPNIIRRQQSFFCSKSRKRIKTNCYPPLS